MGEALLRAEGEVWEACLRAEEKMEEAFLRAEKKDATKKAVEKLKEKEREMAEIKAAEKKAADKKVWADYEKERAKEGRENAEEGCFASRKHQFMNTKSDAFKNMARAARISAEPQKG